MNIIITGGAGFIGINLIKDLIKNIKYKIYVIDSLTYASNFQEIKIDFYHNREQFQLRAVSHL